MADSKKSKSGGNAAGVLGMAIGLLSAAAPIITTIVDKIPTETNGKKESELLVAVPDICMKGFPLTVEQVNEKLLSEGFKMMASEIALKDSHPKYRQCFDHQVVGYMPKGKAKPGTMIDVRYVTQEVIDRSQAMFDEQEKKTAELKAKRVSDRQQRVERVKDGAKKIFSNHGRKEKPQ